MISPRKVLGALSAATLAAAGLTLAGAAPPASAASAGTLVQTSATAALPDQGQSLGWVVLRGRMPSGANVESVTIQLPPGASVPSGRMYTVFGNIPPANFSDGAYQFGLGTNAGGGTWTTPAIPAGVGDPGGTVNFVPGASVYLGLTGVTVPAGTTGAAFGVTLDLAGGGTISGSFTLHTYAVPPGDTAMKLTNPGGGPLGFGELTTVSKNPGEESMGVFPQFSYSGCTAASSPPALVPPGGGTPVPVAESGTCDYSLPSAYVVPPGPYELVAGKLATWVSLYAQTPPKMVVTGKAGQDVTVTVSPTYGTQNPLVSDLGAQSSPIWFDYSSPIAPTSPPPWGC